VKRTSAQRKLGRGIEHLNTLRAEAEAFEDDEPYFFDSEQETRAPNVVEHRCFAIERQAPPEHWPLLAGEAIQNFRSALEHVLYAIKPSNTVQFPIFTDARHYREKGAWRLKGLPTAVRTHIERSQPYVVMPASPADHPLAILSSLSNLDKHRELATLASTVDFEGVGASKGVGINWLKTGTDQLLGHGKTHVSTFVAFAETEGAQMGVNPDFSYEVRVEGLPLDSLVVIARLVYRHVYEIETGQQVPVMATYPI
jgi:hypothetical protein